MKWYLQIYHRLGIWKHLTSPLYIMVVIFVSFLLIPVDLLSITWYPRVYYLTNQNISAGIILSIGVRNFHSISETCSYHLSSPRL